MPGFEAFELLRPTDDRDVFLVYTRWRSQEDFDNWLNSQAFQQGTRRTARQGGPSSTGSELWSFDVVQHEEASRRSNRRRTDPLVVSPLVTAPIPFSSSSPARAGRSRSSSRTCSACRPRSTSSA